MKFVAILVGIILAFWAATERAAAAPFAARSPAALMDRCGFGRDIPRVSGAVFRTAACAVADPSSSSDGRSARGLTLLKSVAIIGDDNRVPLALAEQYRRYSFVGKIMIPIANRPNQSSTLYATGFVVTARHIVVSVAHAFCGHGRVTDPEMRMGERIFDRRTGHDYIPIFPGASHAAFAQVGLDGSVHLYRMVEIRVGTCSFGVDERGLADMRESAAASAKDWAVIKLDREVAPEVSPAQINAVAELEYFRLSQAKVVLVGYHADKEASTAYVSAGTLYGPASAAFSEYAGRNYTFLNAADFNILQDHSLLDAVLAGRKIGAALYIDDLDTKPESSGSPILEAIHGRLYVVAVNSGENSFIDGRPFNLRTNQFNRATAVTRTMLMAVRGLAVPANGAGASAACPRLDLAGVIEEGWPCTP